MIIIITTNTTIVIVILVFIISIITIIVIIIRELGLGILSTSSQAYMSDSSTYIRHAYQI